MASFLRSAVLVFAQLEGFISWRLAQIAKIEKIASTVAIARITRTSHRLSRGADLAARRVLADPASERPPAEATSVGEFGVGSSIVSSRWKMTGQPARDSPPTVDWLVCLQTSLPAVADPPGCWSEGSSRRDSACGIRRYRDNSATTAEISPARPGRRSGCRRGTCRHARLRAS